MDDVKLFEKFGERKILEIIKQALKDGKKHGLDKSFNVNEVSIKNNALLVYYKSVSKRDVHKNIRNSVQEDLVE